MEDLQVARALETVARCADPKLLRSIADNARKAGVDVVEQVALRKLYAVLPESEPGTLEFDVWQSVHALEGTLTTERGVTTRLGRTRQQIKRDGEQATVEKLINKGASAGYKMLLDRDMADLTFEAVALRHPNRFSEATLLAARERLASSGVAAPQA